MRIRDAFAGIGHSPPEPKAIIDSLSLLSQKFGKRAGDMKVSLFLIFYVPLTSRTIQQSCLKYPPFFY